MISRLQTRELWILFCLAGIQFTHILDFMIMMPLGPQFTQLFGISDARFGALVSAYTLAAGASGLIASSYIDRFERKRLLLAMYAGFATATLLCGLAPNYGLLMAARIMAGLFGGVLSALVLTIVGDLIPFERRGRATGIVMSSFSFSTVAGVPISLWLAQLLGWHAPFIAIAGVSSTIALFAWRLLPRIDEHLQSHRSVSHWRTVLNVAKDRNHQRAFLLSGSMLFGSFCIIPYITIYLTTNIGIRGAQIPIVYLCGGIATLFTAQLWGQLSDRWGKVQTFRLVIIAAIAPMLALTHLDVRPLWQVLIVTTAFFIFVSGRMVPGMAIITSTSQPHVRGTFMSLNSSVQSASMGVAAFIGGLLIQRSADGLVRGYPFNGWVAVASSAACLFIVGALVLYKKPETGEAVP